jgi:phosphomannomutase
MITIDPNKICYIFDVDGTLTEPRKQMTYDFAKEFKLWAENKQCVIATGSDYKKTKEQVATNILPYFKYTFCCMGNETRDAKGEIIEKSNFEIPSELELYLAKFLNDTRFPYKSGNHMETRTGMLNFSIVGRNATMHQRHEYSQWDSLNGERQKIANFINKTFPTLEASIGGSISIDIIKKGSDKGQVVRHLGAAGCTKVVFVGDRCFPGGNDYGIVRELKKSDLAFEWYNVEGPQDTLGLIRVNEVFGGGK